MEQEYERWLETHCRSRSGEGLRRLQEGHGHAEELFVKQVWFPAVGHLNGLIPEFEVIDFRDGVRYLDFAYLRPPYHICLEIDGYGPHSRDLSRWQFADQLTRQNHLVLDGWKVLRFSYDEVKEKPRRCQQLIQQMLGQWYRDGAAVASPLNLEELEIVRIGATQPAPFSVGEVCDWIGSEQQHARRLLKRLMTQGFVEAASGAERITRYRTTAQVNHYL